MTVEERIGAADRRKMDGNALFKDDKYEEAMLQYEMVFTNILLVMFSDHEVLEFLTLFHDSKCFRQQHIWETILCFSYLESIETWLWQ